eukprot:scaffold2830_cov173-Amphora_coffeaeformis.AAC.2
MEPTVRRRDQDVTDPDLTNHTNRRAFGFGLFETSSTTDQFDITSSGSNNAQIGEGRQRREDAIQVQHFSAEEDGTIHLLETRSVAALASSEDKKEPDYNSQSQNLHRTANKNDDEGDSVFDGLAEGNFITQPFFSANQPQAYSNDNSILEDDNDDAVVVEKRQEDPSSLQLAESRESPPAATANGTTTTVLHSPLETRHNPGPPFSLGRGRMSGYPIPLLHETDHGHDETVTIPSKIQKTNNNKFPQTNPQQADSRIRRYTKLVLIKRRMRLSSAAAGGGETRASTPNKETTTTKDKEERIKKKDSKEESSLEYVSVCYPNEAINNQWDHHPLQQQERRQQQQQHERHDSTANQPDGVDDDIDDEATTVSIRHQSFSFSLARQSSAASYSGADTTTVSSIDDDDDDDNDPLYYYNRTSHRVLDSMTTELQYMWFLCCSPKEDVTTLLAAI